MVLKRRGRLISYALERETLSKSLRSLSESLWCGRFGTRWGVVLNKGDERDVCRLSCFCNSQGINAIAGRRRAFCACTFVHANCVRRSGRVIGLQRRGFVRLQEVQSVVIGRIALTSWENVVYGRRSKWCLHASWMQRPLILTRLWLRLLRRGMVCRGGRDKDRVVRIRGIYESKHFTPLSSGDRVCSVVPSTAAEFLMSKSLELVCLVHAPLEALVAFRVSAFLYVAKNLVD